MKYTKTQYFLCYWPLPVLLWFWWFLLDNAIIKPDFGFVWLAFPAGVLVSLVGLLAYYGALKEAVTMKRLWDKAMDEEEGHQ